MQSSLETPTIERQLLRRRAAVTDGWGLDDEVVLIGAGGLIPRPGRDDVTYPFEAHSEYYYLTDRNRPGGVLAFDPGEGWVDFVAPITASDRLWSGISAAEPEARTTDDLAGWLAARAGRPLAWLGSAPEEARSDAGLAEELRFGLSRVRRPKDLVELERMRVAQRATSAAFAAVVPLMREGVSEREAQIELEAEAFRRGGDAMAYDTIVGGGVNSAVLHFAPTTRRFQAGDLVLIDAGAQYLGYASDITRTYPVGGRLDPAQQDVHSVVHAAHQAAIGRCRAGMEWREVHLSAALVIAEGLAACGILRGAPESLVQSGAVWLFFPHGIGHLVGLGVRDAGGTPLPERRDDPAPYPNLRIDLPLEPGMVVTVEPGIYFVPAVLEDPDPRRRYRDEVAWDRVDRMLGFGGIRIEDNVLIAQDGYEVITGDVPLLG
ncbi:MAG: aminopeptidase P family protein [Actinomycetota bacterium]|nr:aminopeptidase P family protein [Actinomycetota bacterium]